VADDEDTFFKVLRMPGSYDVWD